MYKNFTNYLGKPPGYTFKLLLIMKLIVVIFLTSIFQVKANSALAQRITISEKNVSLKKVLQQIRIQSGYDIIYNNDLIKSQSDINLNIKNATLQEALEKSLENTPLIFIIKDQTIMIQRKPTKVLEGIDEVKLADTLLVGTVKDSRTNQKLTGVNVKIKGTNNGISTDE